MCAAGNLSEQVQLLINQQLAMTAAEPAAAVDMLDADPPEPPTTRATLKMTTVRVVLCNRQQQQAAGSSQSLDIATGPANIGNAI